MEHEIATVAERLRTGPRTVVLTGSGVSAESGIPTFRDALNGLWSQFKPEDLATPQAFLRNPRRVWNWYAERRSRMEIIEPNAGHAALVRFEAHLSSFVLVTQNIDGLHTKAGNRKVIELHGNIHRIRCMICGKRPDIPSTCMDEPPHCLHCGGLLRPDVVWFGEPLPSEALEQAVRAAENAEIFFSIGTSGVVQPAASLPYETLKAGGWVVELNTENTPLTRHADVVLRGPSARILSRLVTATWKEAW